jgi:uncharacterized protein YndB with AHSA1/START domain
MFSQTSKATEPICCPPDLSRRPFQLTVERAMKASPSVLFRAWTENPSLVEWTFEPKGKDRTFVTAKNWGFAAEANKAVNEAIDSTGGFSFLLAALKAYLEHDIELNLVLDHAPDLLVQGWASHQAAASF